ncbi:MAG: hypothetical protein SGARI_004924 [Bacillariaceae sp.]
MSIPIIHTNDMCHLPTKQCAGQLVLATMADRGAGNGAIANKSASFKGSSGTAAPVGLQHAVKELRPGQERVDHLHSKVMMGGT